ncbi:MAG: DUF1684 domain-containing protein [Bacteroidota bacterium]
MNANKQCFSFFLVCLLVFRLGGFAQDKTAYQKEISEWDKKRAASLLAPDGWINLAGLYWLSAGINRFGSGMDNELVVSQKDIPVRVGNFNLVEGRVVWTTEAGVVVSVADSLITCMTIYEDAKKVPLLALGTWRWNIIKRDDKFGVRLRNLSSLALKQFASIKRYPVNEKWKITAHLEPANANGIAITNVLGQTNTQPSPGRLVFAINGQTYRLDVFREGEQLFILFGDATSGKETYAAGRFLYAAMPDANGNTVLDFNKALNPPCAFSTYATCPLPPKQNILPIAITAGEKDYLVKKGKG